MAVFKFRNLKSGQATPIPPGEFTVGRAEDTNIRVEDSSVSRHHARLINNDQGLFLEDLGSANGVALQGAYVAGRAPVKLGDLVHIGKIPFRVDPETPSDNSEIVPGELRKVDRAFMQRNTERITAAMREAKTASGLVAPAAPEPAKPLSPEEPKSPPDPATLPMPDQPKPPAALATTTEAGPKAPPETSPTPQPRTDLPPEAKSSAAITFSPSSDVVPPRRNQTNSSDSGKLIRQSMALPALAKLTESRPVPPPPVAVSQAVAEAAVANTQPKQVEPVAPAPAPIQALQPLPETDRETEPEAMPWWWWGIVFLAGLGSGLLLGLFFARLFFEMGGKPGSLP